MTKSAPAKPATPPAATTTAAPAAAAPRKAKATAAVPAKKAAPAAPAKAVKAGKTVPPATPAKAPKPVKAAKPEKVAKAERAEKPAKPEKQDKPAKAPKTRPVRDSFTMPEADFALIAVLKRRLIAQHRETKKSELLRAGLHALAAFDDEGLRRAVDGLAPVKLGRPPAAG